MYKKYLAVGAMVVSITLSAKAQCTGMLDSAKKELYRINKVFDSASYLGFDMNVTYYTDTCSLNCSRQEAKTISYQLNAKNYYYSAGNVEYMKNDSFTISIDHDEKTLIVSPSLPASPATVFMLQDFIDYSLNVYDTIFNICITDVDSFSRKITFTANSKHSPYTSLVITYDTESYQPQLIETALLEKLFLDVGPTDLIPQHKDTLNQYLVMRFESYRPIPTGKVFDEKLYFVKQRGINRYLPADKYKYYQFITAGLDEEPIEDNPVEY